MIYFLITIIDNLLAEVDNSKERKSLQDLWDEQLEEPLVECHHQCSGNCRRVGCNCSCGEYHDEKAEQIKPTDNSEKIEEIIKEFNKRFWNRDSKIYHEASDTREILVDTKFLESWLRDRLKQL